MLFKVTTKSLRHRPASLIRRFSRDAWRSLERGDNVSKIRQPDCQLQKGVEAFTRWNSRRGNIRQFEKVSFMGPSANVFRRNIASMSLKMGTDEMLHKGNCSLRVDSQRTFSSKADLPPHQEIGMPSLSPTMTEGNIARWLKKEGDKVSPGEVLCEVETDKATVEMECMEDGYLAKIVRGDGTQGIQVGEVIAVTVEEEEDIQQFKNYTPDSETSGTETTEPSNTKETSADENEVKADTKNSSELPLHQEIGMPSLSPTMTEGNIVRWLKKEGDQVSPGEVLCEVETDKATVEMECMEDGYLAKIIHSDGAQGIQVGEVICVTVEEEEHVQNFKDYNPKASVTETKKPSEPKSQAPSEPTSKKESKTSQPSQVSASSNKGGADGGVGKTAARGKDSSASAVGGGPNYADIPHTQIRKVTASRLLMSKQTIPHYYLSIETCVDNIMELRNELNSLQVASGLKRISVNDLVIKAAALALRKVPQCNSSWMDECIRQYHNVNINVAVQTENGLYVPIVRDADKKGLSTISEEVKQLAQKARENTLKPEDYEGGTFTVSNLGGPFGVKQFCAIVNPPQAAILAVGTAEKRLVPGAGVGQVKTSSFMPVTLSCDHRVVDGAIGAEWLKAFKGFIEDPETMLL